MPGVGGGLGDHVQHRVAQRAGRLYEWLLEVNFGLRGGSPLPARTLLERLLVRLARPDARN